MPGEFHGFEFLTILLTIFWLWMLVDCIKNKGLTGASKLFWVLLILFIHPIGAFIYLIFGRSRSNVQRQMPPHIYYQPPPRQKQQSYYTPPAPQKGEAYSSYQQGYEMQQRERPVSSEGMEQPPVEQSPYDQYEQPQATYPEQAPQQQQ